MSHNKFQVPRKKQVPPDKKNPFSVDYGEFKVTSPSDETLKKFKPKQFDNEDQLIDYVAAESGCS